MLLVKSVLRLNPFLPRLIKLVILILPRMKGIVSKVNGADVSSVSPSSWIRSDEGLTLETSAFRISVRWPIYIINSVDKTKFLYTHFT